MSKFSWLNSCLCSSLVPHYVCKINRALYGLKQAPCVWYTCLNHRLLELDFVVSKSNTSLFIYWHHNVTIYFLVYVDDIILTSSNMEALTQLIHTLSVNFHLKYLGFLHYFLGIECHKSSSSLVLSKKKYILDFLKKANMTNCRPVSTPMSPFAKLAALDSTLMEDLTLYQSIVNSLQYLLFTRPDLSFSINRVCQYMHSPCISDWQVVKHILCYLKHSLDYALTIIVSLKPLLAAFTDAD